MKNMKINNPESLSWNDYVMKSIYKKLLEILL